MICHNYTHYPNNPSPCPESPIITVCVQIGQHNITHFPLFLEIGYYLNLTLTKEETVLHSRGQLYYKVHTFQ